MYRQVYWNDILEPVVIMCLQILEPNSILHDDNNLPHTAKIITEHLQITGVERMVGLQWIQTSAQLIDRYKYIDDLIHPRGEIK